MAHAGPNPKLLVATYSIERYPKGFDPDMYALCFECHDSSLITGKGEDDVTNFRDGNRNLHDLHVQGELKANKYGIVKRGKARGCVACHNPHGSSQPFNLLREYECESVLCYTMTYYPFDDGGKCMVAASDDRGLRCRNPSFGSGDGVLGPALLMDECAGDSSRCR